MKLILALSFFVISIFSTAHAADESIYAEKARNRQYAGGPDESDLKVQAQVLKLQKSKNETSIEEDEGF